jgi:pyruvate,water dikinase
MTPTPLIEAEDEARFGGKASQLARSLRAGLPVPPGFALGVAQVGAVVSGDDETIRQLCAHFTALGGPCAVRSSAIGEDSEAASFAGQHLTLLNVRSAEAVLPAVRRVHESASSEGALSYRRKLGLDPTPAVAVVVQRMIEPDTAGVMFTRNPLNGADERVIEATWGLGEAVVAGLVVPDHWALDPHGGVVRHRTGAKDLALRSDPEGGTVEERVGHELIEASCLSDRQLAELHDLGRRCEARFGSGLDIEWAFSGEQLYLLQCRAMTRQR